MLKLFASPLLALSIFSTMSPNCGGGSEMAAITSLTDNVQTIAVNPGPANSYFNGGFTSVTVCVPGTSSCQTIGGILVDTGSSGLRILSSALTLTLPQQNTTTGAAVVECGQFVDGYTWGPVQVADVKLSGEQASSVPVQTIDAAGHFATPAACDSAGVTPENTLDSLGANGILGVGVFRQDCGLACAFSGPSNPGVYYACATTTACAITPESLTAQVQNPVWLFPTDNNGVMIQFPAVAGNGQATATGSMTFGIGTQANNALGSAKVFTTDSSGNMLTTFGAQSFPGFIDSGSNGYFFLDGATTSLALCPDAAFFYCPAATTAETITNHGINGAISAIAFSVGNADTLLNNDLFSAFGNVGGPSAGNVDWGLPFFFGRTVFTGIEGQSSSGGVGPYWAY
jgi:hypothetical protein